MEFRVKIKENEYFWGGPVGCGTDMPVTKDSKYERDFRTWAHNQMMPLFVSSCGRYT